MSRLVLVLGGARSGKSAFAESLVSRFPQVAYLATGVAADPGMEQRIAVHRDRRPRHWRTVEVAGEPYWGDILRAYREVSADPCATLIEAKSAVLVDCLGFHAARLLDRPDVFLSSVETLAGEAGSSGSLTVVVSNEVGLGVVPGSEAGREFRDLLGEANQMIARHAGAVYLTVAGIPCELKALAAARAEVVPA